MTEPDNTETWTDAEVLHDEPQALATVDRSANALAASAKAMIQARVYLALERPRSLPRVRDLVLAQLKRPALALRAVYAIQRGQKKNAAGEWEANIIEGPSIKLANMLRIAMGNMGTEDLVIADDQDYRTIMCVAIDYESNSSEARTIVVSKTVERRAVYNRRTKKHEPPDREIISSRKNSFGDVVFKCRATEAEIQEAQNSAASRARRNAILALVPADITDDAVKLAKQVATNAAAQQRAATIERLKATYGKAGIAQAELAEYLGRAIDDATAEDLVGLEMLSNAIADGQTTWKAAVKARNEVRNAEQDETPVDEATPPAAAPPKGAAGLAAAVERVVTTKDSKNRSDG